MVKYYTDRKNSPKTKDEAIRTVADYVYNVFKYHLVKYLGVFDIFYRYRISTMQNKEIDEMVASENLSDEETRKIIEEYEYSGKLRDDDIKQSFNEDIGFLERRHKVSLLKSKIIDLVDKFALI